MSAPRRILVRGVNWLGDAVMSTPALLRLREALPGAQVTLLTHAKLAEIWAGHPAIDAVEEFAEGESAWSVGRRLRDGKYDTGLVLPNSPRSALELRLAGIPERVGYAGGWRKWWLTQVVPARSGAVEMHKRSVAEINDLIQSNQPVPAALPPAAHHIHQYLHLAAALGAKPEPLAPSLAVSDDVVRKFAAKFGLEATLGAARPWLGLNAGAEYGPAKRWPEERFVAAAIQLQQRLKCRWLVFGVQADAESAERITAKIRQAAGEAAEKIPAALNLAGRTSLGELCAGLKLCRAVLTNDSGPMHVAAALGTPVVALFGSTSPELTGPGLPGLGRHELLRANAPCSPCFLRECPVDFRCMTGISVEQVVAAVLRAAG
jgi:lipopolysaccharide heptosyltransferase II